MLLCLRLKFLLKFIFIAITKLPQSLVIAIAQEIKLFPFLLFLYTYYKYNIIITNELMRTLKQDRKLLDRIVSQGGSDKLKQQPGKIPNNK